MRKLLLVGSLLFALNTLSAKKMPKFEGNIESLRQYECPEWFKDAKFGIWSCWGPQAVPMQGDWYARAMYEPNNKMAYKKDIYEYHLKNYGHPSKFGYKDLIPLWKAENFDPDYLMKLFKDAGAKYFFTIANHHDNFDLWDSKYTRWNAVDMGPKKDIVKLWQDATQKAGLKFGVSEHLSAAFSWWQSNKGADTEGEYKGVPYDGASDPTNWDLYFSKSSLPRTWTTRDGMFAQVWFARTSDLVESYKPDLLYSDNAMPFGQYGEELVSNFYNNDIKKNRGKLNAVYLSKPARSKKGWAIFDGETCVEDRERGGLTEISKTPWQTDTSIGDWYYNENYKNPDTGTMYRSPFWVISTLIDVVSKNGNMLLNVVQRPDGSVDKEVVELLESIAKWMDVNGESIFETRPWLIFGEGPQKREGNNDWAEDFVYTPQDIRYTRNKSNNVLYATAMGIPKGDIFLKEVAKSAIKIKSIKLLGSRQKIDWQIENDKLVIKNVDFSEAYIMPVFKIKFK